MEESGWSKGILASDSSGVGKYRNRAAKEFDQSVYRWRGMIEAIFRAEESDEHNLRTRFGREDENREVGRHPGHGMEPQGSQQAQRLQGAGNGGDIDHTGELGDNLRENTNDLGHSETWTNEIIGRIASAPSSVTRKDVGYETQKNPGEESRSR